MSHRPVGGHIPYERIRNLARGRTVCAPTEKPETRRKDRKTKVTVTILPTAEAVMKELALAQRDYDEARFVGFTEEELIKYADLSEKIKENTKRILG